VVDLQVLYLIQVCVTLQKKINVQFWSRGLGLFIDCPLSREGCTFNFPSFTLQTAAVSKNMISEKEP
jgi:hypothetical protein